MKTPALGRRFRLLQGRGSNQAPFVHWPIAAAQQTVYARAKDNGLAAMGQWTKGG